MKAAESTLPTVVTGDGRRTKGSMQAVALRGGATVYGLMGQRDGRYDRRTFVRGMGVCLVGVGFAGCSTPGGGEDGAGEDDEGGREGEEGEGEEEGERLRRPAAG